MYIWEYGFDGLYNGLHTCYISVIISMKGWQEKVSARGVFLFIVCLFFQATEHTKQKKIVQKTPHGVATYIVRDTNRNYT